MLFFSIKVASSSSPPELPSSQVVEAGTPTPSRSMPSPPHSVSGGSSVSVASSGSTIIVSPPGVPKFTIPSRWRQSIKKAIEEKKLTPAIRNEIVRDLMYGSIEKPTLEFCKFVAQRLILKYPFMRDTKGTGFVSTCFSFHAKLNFQVVMGEEAE